MNATQELKHGINERIEQIETDLQKKSITTITSKQYPLFEELTQISFKTKSRLVTPLILEYYKIQDTGQFSHGQIMMYLQNKHETYLMKN